MTSTSRKVMFEIYRDAGEGRFRVIFYTELDEHQRDEAIARALAGDPVVDGFLREQAMPVARPVMDDVLARLNAGEHVAASEILQLLACHLA